MSGLLDFLLHVDHHLRDLIAQQGAMVYAILFGIVFAETGLVVTPFLPGDSLLFAAGVVCHPSKDGLPGLNVGILFVLFIVAALAGDNVNYFIGKTFGHRLFKSDHSRFFKRSNLTKTQEFFEKHGKKTIILARFVPIVRTFCPFVAGMGQMPYRKFIGYSFAGAVIWVGIFLFLGYFFGKIPFVEKNFSVAVLGMLVVTGLPICWEVYKAKRENDLEKARLSTEPVDAA